MLEISLFFSYIWSAALYVTLHALSPFTSYQFYLTKGISNSKLDWSKFWDDHKPIKPVDENDAVQQYVTNGKNEDFIKAHTPALNLYRPLVSCVFHFMMSLKFFPDAGKKFETYVHVLFGIAGLQILLTIIYFHVSWYSKNHACWDRSGWWFHCILSVILHFVLPIVVVFIAVDAYAANKDGSNAYSLLLVTHALTCILSSVQFGFFIKRMVCDTWSWYRNRHGSAKILSGVDDLDHPKQKTI